MLRNIIRNSQYRPHLLRHLSTNGSPSKLAYIQHIGEHPLIYENMGQQFEKSVQKYAKRVAIKSWYDQRQLTFEELYEEAAVMAVKLQELGLSQGQHLAVWAPSTLQWFVTFLASALGGFPLVCINPALQKPELKYALDKSKANTLITMDSYGKMDFLSTLQQVVASDVRVVMQSEQKVENFLNYDEWLQCKTPSQRVAHLKYKVGELQPESPFLVLFTSGTTGKPKCALISHYNMVNEAVYIGKALKLDQGPKSICFPIPMFHAFGLSVMAAGLKYGSTLCLPSPTFNPEAALDTIERDKCNVDIGTPTMFVDLIDKQTRLRRNVASLDLALMGGSACSPEILCRTKKLFNVPDVRIGYGMSEATAAVFATDGSESPEEAMLSCGKIFAHGEAKIVDESGKTLEFGKVGELCVRGWFTMLGYFEDVDNTIKTIDFSGWLRTGDQFILESNGVARYQGRKKDMLIRGGENIFPKEIEDVIDKHPSVLESQVIGVPHQRLGEEVCVYIRLKEDARPLTLDDIGDFCKGQLAYFKVPKYVRLVKEFPKTTSGKIQKFKLQQMFQTECE